MIVSYTGVGWGVKPFSDSESERVSDLTLTIEVSLATLRPIRILQVQLLVLWLSG